jgi:hypothetical protein
MIAELISKLFNDAEIHRGLNFKCGLHISKSSHIFIKNCNSCVNEGTVFFYLH